jgi:DNA invertase Pin-like site-specific DNA recombinase
MIYGYARVSTAAQDELGQERQLKAAGCEKVFREKVTGTTADRPELGKLMKRLAYGDVVIISAVDRLSRDTTDLLVIARDMQKAGAGIRSLAEPFLDTTSDFAEIIFAILGVAAKLERRRILDRTARGRAAAKPPGYFVQGIGAVHGRAFRGGGYIRSTGHRRRARARRWCGLPDRSGPQTARYQPSPSCRRPALNSECPRDRCARWRDRGGAPILIHKLMPVVR